MAERSRRPYVEGVFYSLPIANVPFDVRVRLGKTPEGRVVVTGLACGASDGQQVIATGALHRVAVDRIVETLTRELVGLADAAPTLTEEPARRGGQRTPLGSFREAADVYSAALRKYPNAPIRRTAQALGVSSATASRRVSTARDLGYLRAGRSDA